MCVGLPADPFSGHRAVSRLLWICGRQNSIDPVQLTRHLDKRPPDKVPCHSVRIAQTARKHGITDDDMLHAVRNPIAQWQLDDDFTMRVDPAHDGDLLEVGILGIDTDDSVIVHAMGARPRYLPHR